MVEEALATILIQSSSAAGSRVWPIRVLQEAGGTDLTLPFIVYSLVSEEDFPTRDTGHGTDVAGSQTAYVSGGSDDLLQATYQLTCFGANATSAITLAKYIRQYLAGFSGTVADVIISLIRMTDANDNFEVVGDMSARVVDATIWFKE